MKLPGQSRILATLSAIAVGLFSLPGSSHAQASPSAYTTGYRYNALGQLTGTISPDPDGSGPLLYGAVRNTYDGAGNLAKVEYGQLAAWQPETVAPANWTNYTTFTVYKTMLMTYDALHRKLSETVVGSDGSTQTLTQYSYDYGDRLQCTAVRMNSANFVSPPSSACALGTQGSQGPDRINENVYDAVGQMVQTRNALGTSNEEAYATYAYGLDGEQTDVVDANGNHTQFTYDGFNRKSQWNFPSLTGPTAFGGNAAGATPAQALATAGSSNANDYEAYTYDANGNRLSLRKRDGTVLTSQYDNLARVSVKVVPQRSGLPATDARSAYYSYDVRGHQLTAWFDSASSGQGVTNVFDGFGRQTSSSLAMDGYNYPLAYQYDSDGDRTRITHPDGNYVTYAYDGLDRPSTILRSGTSTVASYVYNPDGTRASFNSNGTAVATAYTYDPVDRLASLANNPAGNAAYNNQYGFSYNPANQITQLTKSNNAFAFTGAYNVSRPYTANGLNQYTVAGTASFTYDVNANLTSDGQTTFLYDVENRLVGASGQKNAAIRYDPLGRIYEDAGASGTTRLIYDGDALIAEFDNAGNLLRRYVHGADTSSDNPIAWYEGSSFASSNERLMRPDWQGSIGLVTDTGGTAIYAVNTYDEYGIPGSANAGRFQYTGQAWIPEVGMYYYKARMYSPTLGRFMQTDPIGYKDNVNLYAYVHNDPVDGMDYTGMACLAGGQQSPTDCNQSSESQSRSNEIVVVGHHHASAPAPASNGSAISVAHAAAATGVPGALRSGARGLKGACAAVLLCNQSPAEKSADSRQPTYENPSSAPGDKHTWGPQRWDDPPRVSTPRAPTPGTPAAPEAIPTVARGAAAVEGLSWAARFGAVGIAAFILFYPEEAR